MKRIALIALVVVILSIAAVTIAMAATLPSGSQAANSIHGQSSPSAVSAGKDSATLYSTLPAHVGPCDGDESDAANY